MISFVEMGLGGHSPAGAGGIRIRTGFAEAFETSFLEVCIFGTQSPTCQRIELITLRLSRVGPMSIYVESWFEAPS